MATIAYKNGVDINNIAKINGIDITGIAKINGQDTPIGGGCDSGTMNTMNDETNWDGSALVALSGNARGQSFFISGISGTQKIYSIQVYISNVYGSGDLQIRWGVSNNLTTVYEAGEDFAVTSPGWYEIVFTTNGDVINDTTYYFGIIETTAAAALAKTADGGTYSGGTSITAPSAGYNMYSNSNYDYIFKINLCD